MTHLSHASLALALGLTACASPMGDEQVEEERAPLTFTVVTTMHGYGSNNGPILLGGPNEQGGTLGEADIKFSMVSMATSTVTASFKASLFQVASCTRPSGVGLFHCTPPASGSQLVNTQFTDASGRVLTVTGAQPHQPPAGSGKPAYANEYDFSLTYPYSYFKAGKWYSGNANYCQGPTNWAIPVPGVWAKDGSHTASATSGSFTFACVSSSTVDSGGTPGASAAAKCVDWGYKPWATFTGATLASAINNTPSTTHTGEDMHEVCTRMARADFSYNGTDNTYGGVPIELYDVWGGLELMAGLPLSNKQLSPGSDAPGPAFLPEGAWGLTKVCVSKVRLRRIPNTLYSPVVCPTDEPTQEKDGAVLFSASQVWGVPLLTWEGGSTSAYLTTSLPTVSPTGSLAPTTLAINQGNNGSADPAYASPPTQLSDGRTLEGVVINPAIATLGLNPDPTTTMVQLVACQDATINASTADIWLTTTNQAGLCAGAPPAPPVPLGYMYAPGAPMTVSGGAACVSTIPQQSLFSWKKAGVGYRTTTDPKWSGSVCVVPGYSAPGPCTAGASHCNFMFGTCYPDGYTFMEFEGCLPPATI